MPVINLRKCTLPVAEPEVEGLATCLKVLSNKNRLKILALLMRRELCVCEIIDALKLPQNLISHHLAVLRQEGWVRDRRDPNDARVVYYSIDPEAISKLRDRLLSFLDLSQLDSTPAQCVYREIGAR